MVDFVLFASVFQTLQSSVCFRFCGSFWGKGTLFCEKHVSVIHISKETDNLLLEERTESALSLSSEELSGIRAFVGVWLLLQ